MRRAELSLLLILVAAVGCNSGRRGTGTGTSNGNGTSNSTGNTNCVGLQCQQATCVAEGTTTTLTGTVYAPNGTLPLYNAIVYVPNGTPETFSPGVTCDRCDGNISGDPVVSTQTDYKGQFVLTNVPSGDNIPLIIQIGRWRRKVIIPTIPSCQETALTAQQTRFAKNQTEGDIPQMAIASGGADPFECLLLKIGLDPAEFTPASQTGRVHFFTADDAAGTDLATPAPKANTILSSLNALLNYDIIILPCEGSDFNKSATARKNLVDYANAGGRLFTTHYSYDWLSYSASPFNVVGTWDLDQSYPNDGLLGVLDQSFPKGMAFAQWLNYVAPTTTLGQLALQQPRHDIDKTNASYAQQWITADTSASGTATGVMHMTFGTPVDAVPDPMGVKPYCGKVVYSDFHVTADAIDPLATTFVFPSVCKMAELTPQEKALAFMLFDLSSCVQQDNQQPIP